MRIVVAIIGGALTALIPFSLLEPFLILSGALYFWFFWDDGTKKYFFIWSAVFIASGLLARSFYVFALSRESGGQFVSDNLIMGSYSLLIYFLFGSVSALICKIVAYNKGRANK